MNKCPHPTCQRTKPTQQYACRQHWFSLPKSTRDKIWRGFRGGADLWLAADQEAQEYWNSTKPQGESSGQEDQPNRN